MTPTPVQGSASVPAALLPPQLSRYAVTTPQQAISAKTVRPAPSPLTIFVDPVGSEQEARRRWQLHQQQNSPLSYTQKRGLLHYQVEQPTSPLASLHIEI